jgi:4-methyl-5(b-hydroxyethyl)-thiazole monophosphate biosynthesis
MIAVLLADGFEEIEALTPVDMLRRAGLDVKTVAIGPKIAVGSHGISVICDLEAKDVNENEISMLVLPGGMPGSLNLDASPYTDKFIEMAQKNGGRIAAICAAPYVLGKRGLLENKKATCYPSEKFISQLKGATYTGEKVVTDGKITTSSGMGAALLFGCELLALLKGEEVASSIASSAIIK